MTKERKEILEKDTWDLTALYPSYESWQKAFEKAHAAMESESDEWVFIQKAKEGIESANVLSALFDNYFTLSRNIEKIYTYAHLYFDQDLTDKGGKIAMGMAASLFFAFQEKTSWIQPEILSIEENQLNEWIQSSNLEKYRFYVERMVRLKKHTLNADEERIISLSEKAAQAPSKSFSAFNNADIDFEEATDKNENKHLLTHGTYLKHLRSEDRVLRKSAFFNLHGEYKKFQNTLCEFLTGQIENHLFQKKARNYSSCLETALFPHNIDLSVYKSLLKAVKDKISVLHRYVSLRKDLLQVDKVHAYDLYAPVIDFPFEMDLQEANEKVLSSIKILGDDYTSALKKGLTEERWVDPYENRGKRSGAYSSGCYDSYPYILMNYQGTLNDVMTLAHEAGHSMHSYLSRKSQSYHYADYPIFVAEVASTFNEQLLLDTLLSSASSDDEKKYLIMHELEKIHATFFRQTLFAEFELFMHEEVEKGMILTPELLNEKYANLYREYYGEDFAVDGEYLSVEWARIPHFYYNFYVYQYATGISAAIALFEKTKKDEKEVDRYLSFLKMGGSQFPLDELKSAGVDMCKPDAVMETMEYFSRLMTEFTQ